LTEAASPEGVKVPKAAELVAAQLRRQIVLGARAEGELFPPELQLMTELGVSRPTLRQALRILSNEHLVQVHRGRNGGTRVSRPSTDAAGRYLNHLLLFQGATLEDVHKAQLLIEPAAIAEIAGSIDDESVSLLRRSVAEHQDVSELLKSLRVCAEFHLQLVELTGNRSLTLFIRLIYGQIDIASKRAEDDRPVRDHVFDDHSRLIDLLEAGASREAARHWREHLRATHESLKSIVDTTAPLNRKS
jgi:DNA-binding FadR family transcriptional regulator